MIYVLFCRAQRDGEALESFEVRGHAGYEDAGRDIVCAAVSALAQSTVIGLAEVAKCEPQIEVADGFLQCRLNSAELPLPEQGDAQVLMETFRLAITDIQRQYPDRIRVRVQKTGGEQNAQDSD